MTHQPYRAHLSIATCSGLGALLFASFEGWTPMQGAYFSFITLSTIGFGDLVPGIEAKDGESAVGVSQLPNNICPTIIVANHVDST